MATYLLRYTSTGKSWANLPIERSDINLGREEGNDLKLHSGLVSRQHARLHIDGALIWLIDLNSSNGTYINRQRIAPNQWVAIAPGQYFQIGEFTLFVDPVLQAVQPPAAPSYQQPQQPAWSQPQPAAAFYSQPQPVAMPPAGRMPTGNRKQSSALPWVIGGGGALLLILLVGAVVILSGGGQIGPGLISAITTPALPGNPANATPSLPGKLANATPTVPDVPAKVLADLPVQPGSAVVQDANGVSIALPADSLPEGSSAKLITTQLSSQILRQMGDVYQVDSPAYSISDDGKGALGGGQLSFPAKSDASRMAVLIDGQYFGVMDVLPQNGRLSIEAPIGASATTESAPSGAASSTPLQFFTVSPKSSASLPAQGGKGINGLASLSFADDPDGKSCVAEKFTLNHCWRNANQTIYVFWKDDFPTDLKDKEYLQIIQGIQTIQSILDAYVKKNISTAALSSSDPIYVVVKAGLKSPYYVPGGSMYLDWPLIAASTQTANNCTVAHELMHWIEHKKYWMVVDYYSNAKGWWLDIAAELGSFLLNPACTDHNLSTYGKVETNNKMLGFQDTPFNWDGEKEEARYIQALQAYISTCAGGTTCAMPADAFASAITSGTFPYSNSSAQEAYQRNAKDLGLYLLGAAPQASRTDAHIPAAAKSGSGYGDYLVLKGGQSAGFDFGLTNNQFTPNPPLEVKVNAPLKKGGVYPLWIGNGTGTPLVQKSIPGLPGLLKIEPGTAFWISVDGAAPVFNEGSKPFTLAPISSMGKGLARIVAVAPDGDKTFKASLSLADFSGDWMATGSDAQSNLDDCPNAEPDSAESKKAEADIFLSFFSGLGTYKLDPAKPDGSHLNWEGTLPEGIEGESEIQVLPDQLVLTYHLNIPKQTSGILLPGYPPLAAAPGPEPAPNLSLALPILPLAALLAGRKQRTWRKKLLLAFTLACLATLLVSCFGLGMYGTFDATYTFKKAEYVAPPEDPAAKATTFWNLSDGSANLIWDFYFEVTNADAQGVETTTTVRCKVSATAKANGVVGPEDMVRAPDTGGTE